MRDILVYVDNFKAWNHGVEYAARLAAAEQSALTGAYVYPMPAYLMPPYTTPALLEAMIEHTRKIERESLAAEKKFVEWAHDLGVPQPTWHVAESFPPEALTRLGNWHDLLVLARNDESPWETAGELGALIVRVGLPCLVVPPAGTHDPAKLDCVALAWNGTQEALRAIHAARPWLSRAKRIVLLNGRRHDPLSEIDWRPPFDMLAYLKRHDIQAEVHEFAADDADAGAALLGSAAALRADLLVMGAYGHNRLSEWIFGGATRHVLGHARLPLLLRH